MMPARTNIAELRKKRWNNQLKGEKGGNERMNDIDIMRFIELLRKWQNTTLTWAECAELREFKYKFGDSIEVLYRTWI